MPAEADAPWGWFLLAPRRFKIYIIEMARGMNAWGLFVALAILSLPACTSLSPEKEAVIEKARLIRGFPVPRAKLIASLGLGRQSGQRLQGGVRNRWASYSETWQHASGLTITAYDREFISEVSAIDRKSIDDILHLRPGKPTDFIPEPATTAPRESFHGFVVEDGRKVLFQSSDQ